MPHAFFHRKRHHHLGDHDHEDINVSTQLLKHAMNWERINSFCYCIGGILFCVGSVFFFPQYAEMEDVGVWLFFLGSLLYALVNIHDLFEFYAHKRYHAKKQKQNQATTEMGTSDDEEGDERRQETDRSAESSHLEEEAGLVGQSLGQPVVVIFDNLVPWIYMTGTTMFLVGSICFFSSVALFVEGAYLFVVGSLAFLLGSWMNMMQIVNAPSLVDLQLLNMTALSFVIGSTLFAVASVPFTWEGEVEIPGKFGDFMTWMYIVGSAFFLVGGACNYGRAKRYSLKLLKKCFNE